MPVFDKKQPKRTIQSVINELVERTNSSTQRLRVLEQRTESIDAKINSLEKDLLDYFRDLKKMVGDNDKGLVSGDERMLRMEGTIKEIVGQLRKLATSADIRGLQELIDIYNPVKSNFITREEAERIIEEKINK
jgi:hypothetical protein